MGYDAEFCIPVERLLVVPKLTSHIELRGVEVHNLKQIDLDIPHHQLVVFCGVSGSGKTSLALDTLYAEGQRRYIESFSAYTRQFLERLEKPTAERIDGIPPSIAVTQQSPSRSSRANVGTATEIVDYLRLLYAKIGTTNCYRCGRIVVRDHPDSIVRLLEGIPERTRYMVLFPYTSENSSSNDKQIESAQQGEPSSPRVDGQRIHALDELREEGFLRIATDVGTVRLDDEAEVARLKTQVFPQTWEVVVDRLTGGTELGRVRDSLETAFAHSEGRVTILIEQNESPLVVELVERAVLRTLDGKKWWQIKFNQRLACDHCQIVYPSLTPKLFSFNSPLGACPTCEGFGNLIDIDMDLVVPDPGKTLREGAIAPWNTPAYRHELDELLALAKDYELPVDLPYRELQPKHRRLIQDGVPERSFGGLHGFFAWLEKRKYKMHLRVFLSRWRSYTPCPECHGSRLRPESLATRIHGKQIAEISQLKVSDALGFFTQLPLSDYQRQVSLLMLDQIVSRLRYLQAVGLDYLTLDRPLRTLSGGEAQRVALTATLGSSLVNMLYVLDEPSIGLHPRDVSQLLKSIQDLRDRGNSVIVVEHEDAILRSADHIVEIGPAAGDLGGQVQFQGTPQEMCEDSDSLTGEYLSGRRGGSSPERRRQTTHGWLKLSGATGNNLKDLTVEFPLGVLCAITGVSGSGKSTLIHDTLFPALCRRKHKEGEKPLPYQQVVGDGQLDDVIMMDHSPIGRSPRSNPVTYIKAFDAIRTVFAETSEARTRNFGASHFSFNVDGGRCSVCNGDGYVQIDMQFLADVLMKCSQCQGKRYRQEILDVKYRGKSIADVLDMSVRFAYSFFRGQEKVQSKLKPLLDVGLDYLRLGQPANNLSAGEAQRLKLAGFLATAKRSRTLFLMDEPTTGLHFNDVVHLLDCFEALLTSGHSLIVIEHNLQLIRAADYLIDLGPGAADAGGEVVARGTPEEVARNPHSHTGRFLAECLR